MDNYNLQEKRYSIWKRLAIFVIDGLMAVVIFILLFISLGKITITKVQSNNINYLNDVYQEICLENDYPILKEKQFGLYVLDENKIIEEQMSLGMDVEQAYAEYEKIDQHIEEILNTNQDYIKASNSLYSFYKIVIILCMFLPLLVLQLIIPLSNKKHQTLAMLFFKAAIVKRKDNTLISNNFVLFRFLIIFLVEFLLIYIFLAIMGLIFTVLITFAVICFTNSRLTLHDALLQLKVTSKDFAYNN